jgi:hypothetical protein
VRSFDERLLLYKVVAAYSLEFGQFLLLPVPVDSRKQWGLRWWRGVRGGVVVAVMERYGEEEC